MSFMRSLFQIPAKTIWSYDRFKLANLPVGTKIFENGGESETNELPEFEKVAENTWKSAGKLFKDHNFRLPFTISH